MVKKIPIMSFKTSIFTAMKILSLQTATTTTAGLKKWENVPQTRAQNLICSQTLLRCRAIERQPTARKSQSSLQADRLHDRTLKGPITEP